MKYGDVMVTNDSENVLIGLRLMKLLTKHAYTKGTLSRCRNVRKAIRSERL